MAQSKIEKKRFTRPFPKKQCLFTSEPSYTYIGIWNVIMACCVAMFSIFPVELFWNRASNALSSRSSVSLRHSRLPTSTSFYTLIASFAFRKDWTYFLVNIFSILLKRFWNPAFDALRSRRNINWKNVQVLWHDSFSCHFLIKEFLFIRAHEFALNRTTHSMSLLMFSEDLERTLAPDTIG